MPSLSALALAFIIPGILTGTPSASPVPGPRPYASPPFAAQCHWHRYGDGVAPPLSLIGQEPLCVEYSKRDHHGHRRRRDPLRAGRAGPVRDRRPGV